MDKRNSNELFHSVIKAALLYSIWLRIGLQDIRMRYRRSTLGVGWIFLNLAILILAIGIVYSHLLGQEMKEFLPFLTIGLIGWGYVTSSIVEGGNAFVTSEGYIKQIGLPIYVYVFRFFVSITMTMLISLPAYFVVAIVYAVPFRPGALWVMPGILLMGSVSLLLIAIFSHLNVRFRDVTHIASVGLQVMFFVTPIIWPPQLMAKHKLRWVIDLNPFYHLLEVLRRPLLFSQRATGTNYLVVIIFLIALFVMAWIVTKRYNHRIAYLL